MEGSDVIEILKDSHLTAVPGSQDQFPFIAVELVKDRDTKEPLRRATEKYAHTVVSEIAEYLLQEKNIYIPADKFGIWIVPPLIVSQEDIDFLVGAIDDALTVVGNEVN